MIHKWSENDAYKKCENEECGLLRVGKSYIDRNGNEEPSGYGKSKRDKCPTIYSKKPIEIETVIVGNRLLEKTRLGWRVGKS